MEYKPGRSLKDYSEKWQNNAIPQQTVFFLSES